VLKLLIINNDKLLLYCNIMMSFLRTVSFDDSLLVNDDDDDDDDRVLYSNC